MSFRPASKDSGRSYTFTNLELNGGYDCNPDFPCKGVDLLVQGGARIKKSLCVEGNVCVDGIIKGELCGNLFTEKISEKEPMEGIDVCGNLNVLGDIIPDIDDTFVLGSPENKWANIYAQDVVVCGTLHANGIMNMVDGNLLTANIVCINEYLATDEIQSKTPNGNICITSNIDMKCGDIGNLQALHVDQMFGKNSPINFEDNANFRDGHQITFIEGINIGSLTTTTSSDSISIGKSAESNNYSIAIGHEAISEGTSSYCVSIGHQASSGRDYCVSIGYDTNAESTGSTVIGYNSSTRDGSNRSVAIGYETNIDESSRSVAIGDNASINDSNRSIAIGYETNIDASYNSIAIGYYSTVEIESYYGVSIGNDATITESENSVAIGKNAYAYGSNRVVAVGNNSKAYGSSSVAVGDSSYADASCAVAIVGSATGTSSIAIGCRQNDGLQRASAEDTYSIAIGAGSRSATRSSIVIGESVASSVGSSDLSVIIGSDLTSTHGNAVLIGVGSTSKGTDWVQLGNESSVNTANAEVWGQVFQQRSWVGGGLTGAAIDNGGNIIRGNIGDNTPEGASIFRVDKTACQMISSGTSGNLVTLDTVDTFNINIPGTWSGNTTFTIETEGWYHLNAAANFGNVIDNKFGLYLLVNDNEVDCTGQSQLLSTTLDAVAHADCITHLEFGDTIKLLAKQTTGNLQSICSAHVAIHALAGTSQSNYINTIIGDAIANVVCATEHVETDVIKAKNTSNVTIQNDVDMYCGTISNVNAIIVNNIYSKGLDVGGNTLENVIAFRDGCVVEFPTTGGGPRNQFWGYKSGLNTDGNAQNNVVMGHKAGANIINNRDSVIIGQSAGQALTSYFNDGDYGTQGHVIIGSNTAKNLKFTDYSYANDTSQLIAIGQQAVNQFEYFGSQNIVIGFKASYRPSASYSAYYYGGKNGSYLSYNVVIGDYAAYNGPGSENVIIGSSAMNLFVFDQPYKCGRNVVIGAGAVASGNVTNMSNGLENNVIVGYQAGRGIGGSVITPDSGPGIQHNVIIGSQACARANTAQRCIVMGYNALTWSTDDSDGRATNPVEDIIIIGSRNNSSDNGIRGGDGGTVKDWIWIGNDTAYRNTHYSTSDRIVIGHRLSTFQTIPNGSVTQRTITIGNDCTLPNSDDSILIGHNIIGSTGRSLDSSIGIGTSTSITGNGAVAIGHRVENRVGGSDNYSVVIGYRAKMIATAGLKSICIGNRSESRSGRTIVIGTNAESTGAGAFNSIAIGAYANVSASQCVAIGYKASCSSIGDVQLGQAIGGTGTMRFHNQIVSEQSWSDTFDKVAGIDSSGNMYKTTFNVSDLGSGSGNISPNITGNLCINNTLFVSNISPKSGEANICIDGNIKITETLYVSNIAGNSPVTFNDSVIVQGDINASGNVDSTKLQGIYVSSTNPSNGDVLAFNGTEWSPTSGVSGNTLLSENLLLESMCIPIDTSIKTSFLDKTPDPTILTVKWAAYSAPTSSQDVSTAGLSFDNDGNVFAGYIIEGSHANRNVYNSDGTIAYNANINTQQGYVIDKYNNEGNALWSVKVAQLGDTSGGGGFFGLDHTAHTTFNGNAIIAGTMEDNGANASVIDSSGNTEIIEYTSGGTINECYVVNFDSEGIYSWKSRLLHPQSPYVSKFQFDLQHMTPCNTTGDIYTHTRCRYSTGNIMAEDSDGIVRQQVNCGSSDVVTKWDKDGYAQWHTFSRFTDGCGPIAVRDSTNEIFVTSEPASSTLHIYDSSQNLTFTTTSASGTNNNILYKLNSSGIAQWWVNIRNLSNLKLSSLTVNDTTGDIYWLVDQKSSSTPEYYLPETTTLSFTTPVASTTGTPLLIKFNSSGVPQWGVRVEGGESDFDVGGVDVDEINNQVYIGVVATGTTLTYYNASNEASPSLDATNASGRTSFVLQIDSNGDLITYSAIYTKTSDVGRYATLVAVDPSKNQLYVSHTKPFAPRYAQDSDGNESSVVVPSVGPSSNRTDLWQFDLDPQEPMSPSFKFGNGTIDGFEKKIVSKSNIEMKINITGNNVVDSTGNTYSQLVTGNLYENVCMVWSNALTNWIVTQNNNVDLNV